MPEATAAGPVQGWVGYGGFHRAGLSLSLPMHVLREVLPCRDLRPWAAGHAAVIGALDMRGVALPVIDLLRLLGPGVPAGGDGPAAARPPGSALDEAPVVVVLVHEGRLIGLLADGVSGVFRVADDARHVLEQPVSPLPALVSASLRRADDGSLVGLLDAAALALRPDLPWLQDPEPQRQARWRDIDGTTVPLSADSGDGPAAPPGDGPADPASPLSEPGTTVAHGSADWCPLLLLRCGRVGLAIDAVAVHATVADPRLQPSVLQIGRCLGVLEYGAVRVPALDLLALLGMGELAADAPRQAFVLRLAQGLVALLISEVVDVVSVPRSRLIDVPRVGRAGSRLVRAALPLEHLPEATGVDAAQVGRAFLQLDVAALHADADLCALAAANTEQDGRRVAAGFDGMRSLGSGGGRRAMLIYELGASVATPIDQVQEILPFVPEMAQYAGTGALLGLTVLRGRSIPVMCLSQLYGHPSPRVCADGVSVLVVACGDELLGFAVPRMLGIETARWEPDLGGGGAVARGDPVDAVLRSRRLVQIGDAAAGEAEQMLQLVDLQALAMAMALHGRQEALAA